MLALLTLFLDPAVACDHDTCPHDTFVAVVIDQQGEEAPESELDEDGEDADPCRRRRCRPTDPGYAVLRGDLLGLGQQRAWGAQLRGSGRRDGWLTLEGRWADDGAWMGRFGGGIDLLGASPLDVGIGLVAGHIGDWQTEENQRFSVGTELVIGWHPGRFLVEHRHMGGKRPGGGLRTEGHTTLGFRPMDKLELYLDWAVIDPGELRQQGFGGGVGLRF